MSIPDGYMQNSSGHLVLREHVRPEHLLEDELVRGLAKEAEEIREILVKFRAKCFQEARAFQDMLAEKYCAKRGGEKGNLTLKTYDGNTRMMVSINDCVAFGPELQIAKDLVDGCLKRWSTGANKNLSAIVNDAFDVGKEGKLRKDKILGLLRLNIEDEEWQRAMQAISDSIRIDTTREYVRFHERLPVGGWGLLPLDMAKA